MVRARCLAVCGTCRLYLSCPYGEGVALEIVCPLTGSWDSGQFFLRRWFGQNTACFALATQVHLNRRDALDEGLNADQRSPTRQNPSNDDLEFF